MRKIIVDQSTKLARAISSHIALNASATSRQANNSQPEKDIIINPRDFDTVLKIVDRIIPAAIKDFVVFINLNLLLKDGQYQDEAGIELFKWLRLRGLNNHCIVYSFLSIGSIVKRKPANSILLSKGASFFVTPFSAAEIEKTDITELSERENLVPFFRAEVDLLKVRHELANIWGLKRLEWLLKLQKNDTYDNFSIELLRFISSEKFNRKISNIDSLESRAKWFHDKRPEILYYDDMAASWGPVLKKLLGSNLRFYTPEQKSPTELFATIESGKPKCLLLDLRLKDEKDQKNSPLLYSGGKLLSEIKDKYFSLPVIMFTGTNKAESVRKLTGAGAEYVWTKEGVDDGIDDLYTLKNVEALLDKVKESILKFDNEIHSKIFEVESKITNTTRPDDLICKVLTNGALKNIGVVVIDSNYLLDGLKDNSIVLFNKILIANKSLHENKKEIVIHEDVFNEIFIISKQNENAKDKDGIFFNKERVPIAQLLIKLLYRWAKKNMIKIPYKDGQTEAVNRVLNSNITEVLSPLEQIQIEQATFFERIAEVFRNKQQQQFEQLNKQIENFNSGLLNLPDLRKIALHADDTFIVIVPQYVEKQSVVFVTNDHTCACLVGREFDGQKSVERHTYRCKFNKEDKSKITEINSIKAATVGTNRYQHLFNTEFNALFR